MVDRLEQTRTLSPTDDAALYQIASLFGETETLTRTRTRLLALSARLQRATKRLDGADLASAAEQIGKLEGLAARQGVQVRQGRMAIRQYLVEFGLTPSARTRVTVPPAPDVDDPFAEFDEPNPLAKYLKKGHRQTNHNARHQDGRTRGAALRRLQDEARRLRQPQPAFDDTDPEVRCG